MNVRYRVDLNDTERRDLQALVGGGTQTVRTLKRAQILLAADAGVGDAAIAASVAVGTATVYRTKRRFVEGNLDPTWTVTARKPLIFQHLLVMRAASGATRLFTQNVP